MSFGAFSSVTRYRCSTTWDVSLICPVVMAPPWVGPRSGSCDLLGEAPFFPRELHDAARDLTLMIVPHQVLHASQCLRKPDGDVDELIRQRYSVDLQGQLAPPADFLAP